MVKKHFLFVFILVSSFLSAHDLPHQLTLDEETCYDESDLSIFTLVSEEISQWYNPYADFSHLIPQTEENQSITDATRCTIYDKGTLCGEVDHFMEAALAATSFCDSYNEGVPSFIGPPNFMSTIGQEFGGAHHDDYDISEGIIFVCVPNCEQDGGVPNESDS